MQPKSPNTSRHKSPPHNLLPLTTPQFHNRPPPCILIFPPSAERHSTFQQFCPGRYCSALPALRCSPMRIEEVSPVFPFPLLTLQQCHFLLPPRTLQNIQTSVNCPNAISLTVSLQLHDRPNCHVLLLIPFGSGDESGSQTNF